MRVISGSARGIKLDTIPEMTTRPTVDRVKENMFNIIQYEIDDAIVLDLFSGSGSLCIECLSRGARKAYFIERNPKCIPIIEGNLKRTRLEDLAVIENTNYEHFLAKSRFKDDKFDIIFLDPPHRMGMGFKAMELIDSYKLLADGGIIVVEHHSEEEYPDAEGTFEKYKYKKYGKTALSFYRIKED
jgi:16S rRNA (guanine(966)-N(2))-methyltransferase RsmD